MIRKNLHFTGIRLEYKVKLRSSGLANGGFIQLSNYRIKDSL